MKFLVNPGEGGPMRKRDAKGRFTSKGGYDPTLHRDGTVSYWSVYQQRWRRHQDRVPQRELAAMGDDRDRVMRHLGMTNPPRDKRGRFKSRSRRGQSTKRRRTPPRDASGRFRARKTKARTNPKGRKRNMARKRLPPRDSKGRFKRGRSGSRSGGRKRSNPGRRVYRKNPAGGDLVEMATTGTVQAAQILTGKALTRSVPEMAGLPKQGNTGLAVQVLVAVALGYISDRFLSREAAAAILAGGLTAPLESFIVQQRVPWISEALEAVDQVAPGGGNGGNVGRYPERPALVAGYPGGGDLSRYAQEGAPAGFYYDDDDDY